MVLHSLQGKENYVGLIEVRTCMHYNPCPFAFSVWTEGKISQTNAVLILLTSCTSPIGVIASIHKQFLLSYTYDSNILVV